MEQQQPLNGIPSHHDDDDDDDDDDDVDGNQNDDGDGDRLRRKGKDAGWVTYGRARSRALFVWNRPKFVLKERTEVKEREKEKKMY